MGDKITLKAGEYITKEYKDIDVSGFDKTNIQVLAFINVVGASSSEHSIINAQEVKVGETKKWN